MDEPRACYTEWSKSEKIKCINTYEWNLKEWYWNNLQGRNGDADVENGLGDTLGEGARGMNGESSINLYTLLVLDQ